MPLGADVMVEPGSRRTVLAVDPGGTTGWALWRDGDQVPQVGQDPPLAFLDRTWDLVRTSGGLEVVCERYVVTAGTLKKSRQYDALEQIGALRWMCHHLGHPFELQDAADAEVFAPSERLKLLGWWTVGQEHARSATRHLLLYLVKRRLVSPGRLGRADG